MRKKLIQLLLSFVFLIAINQSASSQIVISQVYGGGGNSGATYTNDFIELFNRGNSPIDITGWSVQYASATGTGNFGSNTTQITELPSVILQPGQYFLVQEASGLIGSSLPTPDFIDLTPINLSGASGKVALVNTITPLGCNGSSTTCSVLSLATIVDLIGYGSANFFEGAGTAPTLSNTTAAIRNGNGCTDTNNNSADFSTGAPTPRNTASPLSPCSGPPVLSVSVVAGTDADESGTNGTFNINLAGGIAPVGGITVTYSLNGSATINADYVDPQAGSITIPQGSTTAIITLNVINDIDIEGSETIEITINSVTSPVVIGTSIATINIIDNDFPVNPNISLINTYSQDFNSLANSGTSSDVPNGWLFSETGTNSNLLYTAGTGSSTSGDTYSFGAASNSDRAFGTLLSGSLTSTIGAQIQNNSGTTITKLKISFTGEQWRLGATARTDKLSFQYSLDATTLSNGTWTDVSSLDFFTPNTTTTGAKDGNASENRTALVYTLRNLSIPNGAVFRIRWVDFNAAGSDDGLAIDDFAIEANPVDLTPPTIVSLSPANGATDLPVNITAAVQFNEEVAKGSGNIRIRKISDNSIFQTIDINAAVVSVSSTQLNITLSNLEINTSYYLELDNGSITDLDNNPFAGIAGSSTWAFTTGINIYVANFHTCTSGISDGFTQYSVTGALTWACTTFGHDPNDATGLLSLANGVQMNGFSGGTNVPNEDWLISPSFDLTGTIYPLLSFWSRTAFNGQPLHLKVSTDYTSGDPALATWTDINGKFPGQTSNVWALSENINLAAFKQSNVHFAFVYTSSDDDGARWTIDDISLGNSPTPPPPSLTVSTTDIQFAYVANGANATKTFSFTGNDLTDNISLNATGAFTISKDDVTYSNALVYTIAEANDLAKTVYVRFTPTQNNQNFSGTVTASTSSLSSIVNLLGTSIDPVTTLEVVNWNVEWFGSTSLGPSNDAQQQANVQTILQNIGADIYGLVEVVDEARLANVVANMPGYSYVICNYGSHTNPTEAGASPLSEAQKEAFIYKTSLFSNVTTTPLLSAGINTAADLTNPNYNYWSSGRFPFMLSADVTLNCVTKNVKFVLVHAKANTSPTATSYDRRKNGAIALYNLLQDQYSNHNIVILGDFNDDLDQSITAGFTTTSWNSFTDDIVNFDPVTLPLSIAGKKSTVSYNDVIDHVVISNEMHDYYLASTANILSDVTSLVTNYGSTTTDHYPVFSRYRFSNQIAPTVTTCTPTVTFCSIPEKTYTIPAFIATDDCGDLVNYTYAVTGATVRNGSSNDASGTFNNGTSVITWIATDSWGNSSTCQTSVVINAAPSVTIPDAYALPSGTLANTVYLGYTPASTITLNAIASGGTSGYSYNWSSGSTTNSTTVGPVVTTTYSVTITDANSCAAVTNKTVNVIDIRGGNKMDKVEICHKSNSQVADGNSIIAHLAHGDMLGSCPIASRSITAESLNEKELVNKLTVQVLPNPSTGYFTLLIQSAKLDEKINVRISDITGRVIEQKQNFFANQSFKIGFAYQPGLYFVEITQGNEKSFIKLIKL